MTNDNRSIRVALWSGGLFVVVFALTVALAG